MGYALDTGSLKSMGRVQLGCTMLTSLPSFAASLEMYAVCVCVCVCVCACVRACVCVRAILCTVYCHSTAVPHHTTAILVRHVMSLASTSCCDDCSKYRT